jgi:hypothetical protein
MTPDLTSTQSSSRQLKFTGKVPAGGVNKKKGLNGDVQGRLVLAGAHSNVSAKIELIYLNDDFLRRAAPHEEFEVEVVIRKKG